MVAVTAFAMREDRERASAAGFDGYVEKPFSPRELPAQVRSFLRRGRREWGDDDPGRRRSATEHPTARCSADPSWLPGGQRHLRRGGAGSAARRAAAPRPAGRLDARHGRPRGVPADPVESRHGVPPGRDGDRERVQEKVRAIESGADDFVTKPFDQAELLARVRSLVRIKRYQDTISQQADELEAWNRQLERRVQPGRRARAGNPAAPLPPPRWPNSSSTRATNRSWRATAAKSWWCSATFGVHPVRRVERAEEIMGVLSEYYAALGDLVFRFEGTLERFTGDG